MEFFENLDPLLKLFWYVAIPTSVIFLIQTILTFIGLDSSDGLEADFDGDLEGGDAPFQLFSLRNLINFLLGFSWTGISLYNSIASNAILITCSVLVGLGFVFIFFAVIRQITKLAEDNSFKLEMAIGRPADVYLRIPAEMAGKGKVMLSFKGSSRELDAMTRAHEEIPSGAVVRVLQVDGDILIVDKI